MQPNQSFTRICPVCGKTLFHTRKHFRDSQEKQEKPCKQCSMSSPEHKAKFLGENNPFHKSKLTTEILEKRRLSYERRGYDWKHTKEYREKMSKINSENPPMKGKTIYGQWLKKYGKEEADKRLKEWKEKHYKNTPRGETHCKFGKVPNKVIGYKSLYGWYKGVFFRSLTELMYLIWLIDNNIPYESLEQEKFAIPYEWEKQTHHYFGDFLVENKYFVEIKPQRLQSNLKIVAKKEAAEKYCKERGYIYKFENPLLDYELLKGKYLNGDIKPHDKFIQKFENCFRIGKDIKRVFQKSNSTYRGPNNVNSTPEPQNITNSPITPPAN